ncbi:uncharacterized protein [Maniola hyperantus]|uniref:uncharacterized protein n=1 Tax=Aphantopus hyperantus TaxID=2795564 RepID=UPI00374828CC
MSLVRIGLIVLSLVALAHAFAASVSNYEQAKAELEEYIQNKRKDINPRFRPLYHVAPPVGWMNDPNGFSFHKGVFHLFYQFYPYDSVWGPMHWGHASSPDLVNWDERPTALLPEREQCWSGSAISQGDRLTLMYTAHADTEVEPFFNETQYLAFGDEDSVNFQKYKGNPVIAAAPDGQPDFRDPKVWKHGDDYYSVIGSKTWSDRGRVLLYKSKDIKNWEFVTVLGESDGGQGYMWECPDFFELDGRFVLLISPQGMQEQGDRYKNTNQNGYIIGSFSYDTNQFVPEVGFQEIDFGHDFYAAQTTEANGKRYLSAWFAMWGGPHHEDVDGWSGMLTIPRELRVVGDRVTMNPVEEIVSLRDGMVVDGAVASNQVLDFGRAVELIIESDLSQKVDILLDGREGGLSAWLRWDPEARKVVVDRGSGDVRQVEWSPIGSKSWRVFLDTSSVELFCGEGEVVLSSRVYPLGGLVALAHAFAASVSNYEQAKAELEEYIQNKRKDINPRFRPLYHVAPPVGWMNDPNGFSFHKGVFHLFYQFYPYDSVWGPMHWGHASSPDLVNWDERPTALLPEREQCFSGSAVTQGDRLTLMYTAHTSTDVEPFFNQTQFLAFGDDDTVNFHKYEGNPVIPVAPNLQPDFRDPKVWKHGDDYYSVIGSKTWSDRGLVLLYKSKDMKSWEFLSVLAESDGGQGYMWECPDFFELDGRFVLLISPQGMQEQGDRYKNTNQNGYIIGSFSYDTNQFVPEVGFQEIDFGHDFYAAQTTEANGKRYLSAWFAMWGGPHHEDVDGWSGMLTIPRELRVVGDRVTMNPVEEIVSLRDGMVVDGAVASNQVLDFGRAVELIIESDLSQKVDILLDGREGGLSAWLRWDPEARKVVVDRGSGDVRQVEWSPIGSKSWRVFLDTSSVELFCGEGEVVLSSRVYPLGGWRLTNQSPQTIQVKAYNLRRSVRE